MSNNLAHAIWTMPGLARKRMAHENGLSLEGTWGVGEISKEALEWVEQHRRVLLPALFRHAQLPCSRLYDLVLEEELTPYADANASAPRLGRAYTLHFSRVGPTGATDLCSLPNVAATSLALLDTFIDYAAATHPFEGDVSPPAVTVSEGSLAQQLAGAGAFGSVIALLVDLSTQMPYLEYAALGVSGFSAASIAALRWRREGRDEKTLEAELGERYARIAESRAKARKTNAEAMLVEQELQERRAAFQHRAPDLQFAERIPREKVDRARLSAGLSEEYANYALNSVGPRWWDAKLRLGIEVEGKWPVEAPLDEGTVAALTESQPQP